MTFIERIRMLERLDQLIRMKATGSPRDLSERLKISERTVYYLIDDMRQLGAEIKYCKVRNHFEYENNFSFKTFHTDNKEEIGVKGGHTEIWMQALSNLYLLQM